MAAGSALVVACRAAALYRRGMQRFAINDSNEDDFFKNLLTVRVEERVAFATYMPTGFASATGLVTSLAQSSRRESTLYCFGSFEYERARAREFIWWPVEFIGFERGIVLRRTKDAWVTHERSRAGRVEVQVDAATERWKPVVMRCRLETASAPLDIMLLPNGRVAPRVPQFGFTARLHNDAFAVQYFSSALMHHLFGIVRAYERIRDQFKDFDLIPGMHRDVDGRAMFGSHPEPYYEFDGLLGVARRGYDTSRYVLWKCFGPGKGTMPRSFEAVLPFCSRLSPDIRDRLQNSWDEWGALITTYRDCIHHYVPLDFGLASIFMQQSLPGVWAAWARIPDNPEARSKSRFTYAKDLDALTFGWHIAAEVSLVLRIVSAAVEEQEAGGERQT